MDGMDTMDTNGHIFYGRNGHLQQVTFFLRLSIRPSNGKSIASILSMMSIRVPVH
jgi:hypothetical protein